MNFMKLLFPITALVVAFGSPAYGQGSGAEALLRSMNGGKIAFERECSACHPGSRALLANYDQAQWRDIISNMPGKKAVLARDEVAAITLFLAGGSTFNSHCVSCHDRDRCFSRSMDLQNWTMIVRKMKLRIEGGLTSEEADTIAAYLAASCPEK